MDTPVVRLTSLTADSADGARYTLALLVDGAAHTVAFEIDDDGASAEPDDGLTEYLELLSEDAGALDPGGQRRYLLGLLVHEIVDRVAEAGLIFPFTPADLLDDDELDDLDDEDLDDEDPEDDEDDD